MMGYSLENWIENNRSSITATEILWNTTLQILGQILDRLDDMHSRGQVHGCLTPWHVLLEYSTDETAGISLQLNSPSISEELLEEWLPANEKPSEKMDVFSLGCLFEYVHTRGKHPFGRTGQRAALIAHNLYDLTDCRDVQLQKLIERMISPNLERRPLCTDLKKHPLFWKREQIEHYFIGLSLSDDCYKEWSTNTILFPSKDSEQNSPSKACCRSVSDILINIQEKKEDAVALCKTYPELLSTVYFTVSERKDKIDDDDGFCPETLNNLMIANERFGEVQVGPISMRNGRFGSQHVHVMHLQTSGSSADFIIKHLRRIRSLSHPNLLQCFYVSEHSSKICMAFEPFKKTLQMWLNERINQLDFRTTKEILWQVTKGLAHYHTSKLVHGSITTDQIILFEKDDESVTVKVSKFIVNEENSCTVSDDIQSLGKIYVKMLSQMEGKLSYSTRHLRRTMKSDKFLPPSCEAILYHPFFWSPDETRDFLLMAGEFYANYLAIDQNSSLIIESGSPPLESLPKSFNIPIPKTNREAIAGFLAVATKETPEKQTELAVLWTEHFTTVVLLTWLSLQKFRNTDDDSVLDIDAFFSPDYDFQNYDKLKMTRSNSESSEDLNVISSIKEGSSYNQNDLLGTTSNIIKYELEGSHYGTLIEPLQNFLQKRYPPLDNNLSIREYLDHCVQRLTVLKKSGIVSLNNGSVMHSSALSIDQTSGRTVMHLACHSDSFFEAASKLLDFGVDINAQDRSGFAPLHIAAWNNCVKIAQLLIENQAIIDICDMKDLKTPLFLAVSSNSIMMTEMLLKSNASASKVDALGRSALHIAVARNSIEIAKFLLKGGYVEVNLLDLDGNSPLCIAVAMNSIEMTQLLLSFEANINLGNQNSPLHLAVVNNDNTVDVIDLLLRKGADPNSKNVQGQTALHLAALLPAPTFGQIRLDIVNLLLQHKAKPDAVDKLHRSVLHVATFNQAEEIVRHLLSVPNIEVDPKESTRKITPLHLAAWYDYDNIAQLLIDSKAKIDAKDINLETPLEYAASANAARVAKRLLEAGAKAKSKRWRSRSPLHIAAAHGAKDVGQLLISKGADINATDELDLTPLHYAKYCNQKEFVQLLQKSVEQGRTTANSPLSEKLTPDDLALIPQLTNSFKKFSDVKITVNQELQLLPSRLVQFHSSSSSEFSNSLQSPIPF